MYVLGLNAFHGDSSAAILKDGHVIAAVEEERFTRVKHWSGVPYQSIDYCLLEAGIEFNQLQNIAINTDSKAHRYKKLLYAAKSRPNLKLLLSKLKDRSNRYDLLRLITENTDHDVSGVTVDAIEHHFSHLASAYYPSAFESCALFSVDGFGDFSSGAMGTGLQGNIQVDKYVHFPNSLGIFYQAITQYLGFPNYGDEYKVMGLSSFGQNNYISELSEILSISDEGNYQLDLSFFRHHRESVHWISEEGVPEFDTLFSSRLESLLGPRRMKGDGVNQKHKDIAASAQHLYEKALFSMLRHLQQKTNQSCLAMAGGCAMNSVANGKILANTNFEQVFVQPAGGDAGGAIGAALASWKKQGGAIPKATMPNAYLGPGYSQDYINGLVSKSTELKNDFYKIDTLSNDNLVDRVSTAIVEGAVVGWFQGRMEWGARALGNRSIIADPRRNDMQELLNSKIKRRESFRPFAPSILADQVSSWFSVKDSVPYMEKVYPIKPEMQSQIPAVTHVDGTGRLQTVEQSANPRYYSLIESFFRKTGVPILLNTSFNENEPIVCTPDQALDCFLRTKMDMLVMENTVVTRLVNK
jgi:carbamoyltransferase